MITINKFLRKMWRRLKNISHNFNNNKKIKYNQNNSKMLHHKRKKVRKSYLGNKRKK